MRNNGKFYLKIVFCGEGGVGKSTIINWLLKSDYKELEITTGVDVHVIKDSKVNLLLWDIGGQERFRKVIDRKILGKSLVGVFVFDLSRPKTLDGLVEKWLKKRELKEIPIKILVANKKDLSTMDGNDLVQYAVEEYGFKKGFITSAKTGEGLSEFFHYLLKIVKNVEKIIDQYLYPSNVATSSIYPQSP
ncbi:MAG: Rab family GTPase [Candidatus Njordarchaeia archaeon]